MQDRLDDTVSPEFGLVVTSQLRAAAAKYPNDPRHAVHGRAGHAGA